MSIRIILHSFSSVEENISAEEFLFQQKNQCNDEDILRIWESEVYFIVLGSSQSVDEEVFLNHCLSQGIKIIRRCSAGGAVLQGPGCINFSLFLNLDKYPQLRNIRASYDFLLSKLSRVLYQEWQLETTIEGISDLCYMGKKISGNAQRRNSKVLLHHGTLLYRLDYNLLENTLKIPRIQPEYRAGRTHKDFVGILPLSRQELINCILKAFASDGFDSTFTDIEIAGIKQLVRTKYSKKEWNFKR
ncbi:MAG: lipoate--protein ligase family protein [Candidatus Hydrogenedens sp.]